MLLRALAVFVLSIVAACQLTYAASEDTALNSISSMQIERTDSVLYLNAQLKFDLPSTVEAVLLKGIPLIFVADIEVKKERWYWYDKKLVVASRQMRLAYQPLTRRWRLNVASGTGSSINFSGLAGGLPQYFDTMAEAMSNLQRIRRWRIVDTVEIEIEASSTLELSFKLDVSQLPRPFQIGLIGQDDWNISASKTIRITPESIK